MFHCPIFLRLALVETGAYLEMRPVFLLHMIRSNTQEERSRMHLQWKGVQRLQHTKTCKIFRFKDISSGDRSTFPCELAESHGIGTPVASKIRLIQSKDRILSDYRAVKSEM
jgi:hypothetical protein